MNKMLQAVFESSVEGILVESKSGKIILANPACGKMFGYTPEEMKSMEVEMLLPLRFKDKHSQHRVTFNNSQRPRKMGESMDLTGIRSDGRQFPLEISLSPTTIEGENSIIAFILDVTERKKIESSNNDFAKIIEESLNEIHIFDVKTSLFILVNATGRENLGYTMEELRNMSPIDILPAIDIKEHKKMLEPLLRGKSHELKVEAIHARKNGTTYHVETYLQHTTFGGRPVIKALIIDITERKKAEQLLLESNRKYATLLGNLPGIVYHSKNDKEWTMDFISEGCFSITGYHSADFTENKIISFGELILEEYKEKAKQEVQAAINEKRSYQLQFKIFHKSGKIRWVKDQGEAVFNKSGDLEFLEGFITDITKIKAAEEELIENREHLSQYAEQLETKVQARTKELSAIVKKLVESNLKLEDQAEETRAAETRAREVNELYKAIVRYLPNSMIVVIDKQMKLVSFEGEERKNIDLDGRNVRNRRTDDLKFLSAVDRFNIKESVSKTLKGAHLADDIIYGDRNYRVNSMPLYNMEGQAHQALFLYTNITVQKRKEKEMTTALKKEKKLNELKSLFVSLASHEFRTPLGVILSAADLIALQNGPGKEENRLKNIRRIRSNVKNLTAILNDFLSVGKLEEGLVKIRSTPFEIVGYVKVIIAELRQSNNAGQEILLTSILPSINVNLDKQILKNILLNLFSNAFKYTKKRSTIKVSIDIDKSNIYINIEDQGIGIPQGEQEYLFNRFFRAQNVTNIQGTGLGLHIVKRYTQLLGGKISFKSELNIGTTFTIALPLK